MLKNIENIKLEFKNTDCFIFDMDGTIVDLENLNKSGYSLTLKKFFGLELTSEEYQHFFSGTKTARAFESFCKSRDIEGFNVDELIADFRARKREVLNQRTSEAVILKDKVVVFFKTIKKHNKKICLATSTVKEFVDTIVDFFNLKSFFDVVLTADDVAVSKPSPEIYNSAIRRIAVKKKRAVVFEDSLNGILSAQKAGIFCIGIHNQGWNDDFIDKADAVIESYSTCIKILNESFLP